MSYYCDIGDNMNTFSILTYKLYILLFIHTFSLAVTMEDSSSAGIIFPLKGPKVDKGSVTE